MRWFVIALAVMFNLTAFAQMEIGVNQYLIHPFVINPATAGKEECQTFSMNVRRQWVNLEINQTLQTFSIDANLSKGGIDNFKPGWHGVGGQIVDMVSGNYRITRFMGAYAYHLRLKKDMLVSFGSFVSLKRMLLLRSDLNAKHKDDPLINGSSQTFIFPEISPGIWFSSPKYFGGISIWNISHRKNEMLRHQVGEDGSSVPHYYVTGGMLHKIDDYYHFTPSIHIRFAQLKRPSIDINTLMRFGPYFKAGIGYRWQDAITSTIQFSIRGKFDIGYGFDYTVSKLRYQAGHSHEVFLRYTPCIRESGHDSRFWCPSY